VYSFVALVVLDLILQPRFVLLDKPEDEAEWSLQKTEESIRCGEFII
jgi:hypothetical protein